MEALERGLHYTDGVIPGLKMFLTEIGACKDETVDRIVTSMGTGFPPNVRGDIWRALRNYTEDDVRRIVETAEKDDGYEGWRCLCHYFEPALAAQQTAAMSDLMLMVRRQPSKSLTETKLVMLEFATKVRAVEAISKEKVSDTTLQGILTVIIDDETKKHTPQFQGEGRSAETFRRAIVEFVNTASTQMTSMTSNSGPGHGGGGRGPAPMQINPVAGGLIPHFDHPTGHPMNTGSSSSGESPDSWDDWGPWNPPYEHTEMENHGDDTEYVMAMKGKGKGKGACWSCGRTGHQARDCWLKGKGKGGKTGQGWLPILPFKGAPTKGTGRAKVRALCSATAVTVTATLQGIALKQRHKEELHRYECCAA